VLDFLERETGLEPATIRCKGRKKPEGQTQGGSDRLNKFRGNALSLSGLAGAFLPGRFVVRSHKHKRRR
jgi:hypothetical protein